MEADANEEELVKETDLFPGCADMDEFLQVTPSKQTRLAHMGACVVSKISLAI